MESKPKNLGGILEDLDWLNNTGLDQLISQAIAHLVDLVEYKNKHNSHQLDTITHQYGRYYVHLQGTWVEDKEDT